MNILLCSTSTAVLKRWADGLDEKHRVFEAEVLSSAYRIIDANHIDLTLLHRSMISAKQIQEIVAAKRGNKIFILSDRPDNSEGVACLKLGCCGYANAYIAQPRLNLAVDAIQSGLIWTGTSLMQHMIQASAADSAANRSLDNKRHAPILDGLSKREYQVAALVMEGLNNREIAERLDITERTVKAHLSSAYTKTATKSRFGLARLFSQTG